MAFTRSPVRSRSGPPTSLSNARGRSPSKRCAEVTGRDSKETFATESPWQRHRRVTRHGLRPCGKREQLFVSRRLRISDSALVTAGPNPVFRASTSGAVDRSVRRGTLDESFAVAGARPGVGAEQGGTMGQDPGIGGRIHDQGRRGRRPSPPRLAVRPLILLAHLHTVTRSRHHRRIMTGRPSN